MNVHHAVLQFSAELIIGITNGTYKVVSNPVPNNAVLIDMHCIGKTIFLTLEHESFPEVKEGNLLTVLLPPLIEKLY